MGDTWKRKIKYNPNLLLQEINTLGKQAIGQWHFYGRLQTGPHSLPTHFQTLRNTSYSSHSHVQTTEALCLLQSPFPNPFTTLLSPLATILVLPQLRDDRWRWSIGLFMTPQVNIVWTVMKCHACNVQVTERGRVGRWRGGNGRRVRMKVRMKSRVNSARRK